MRRRNFLKGSFAIGAGALLGTSLAACSATAPSTTVVGTSQPLDGSELPVVPASRVLLAYFSRAGENYYYGDRTSLEIGNTQVVAELISSAISVDVFRIEAEDPYPDSYEATVARNVAEQNSDARPAIAGVIPSIEGYEIVLLGSGIWNVEPPMIMRTFVESVDLSGTTIFPFITYAVSGLGRTIDDYTRLCPRSTIGEGLAIRGEEATRRPRRGGHLAPDDRTASSLRRLSRCPPPAGNLLRNIFGGGPRRQRESAPAVAGRPARAPESRCARRKVNMTTWFTTGASSGWVPRWHGLSSTTATTR